MTAREQLQAIQDRARTTGETREVPGVGHVAVVSITRHELVTMAGALLAVLGLVESLPHDLNDDDCWYSCSQAKDPYSGEWATCDDSRAGGPCDCGRDTFVDKVNRAVIEALA